PATHLSESNTHRTDTVIPSCSVNAEPEPGNHLVQNQQGSLLRADLPDRLHVFGILDEQSVVSRNALDNHRRDTFFMVFKCLLYRVDVIQGGYQGFLCKGLGNSCGSSLPKGDQA